MINLQYAQWKDLVDQGLPHYYSLKNNAYILTANDEGILFVCYLESDDVGDYEANYKASANKIQRKVDALGYSTIVTENPSGDFDTLVSHNWCDKNTWAISTTDSTWTVEPSAGKVLEIGKSEVQFEHDVSISGVTKLFIDYYIWHPLYPGTPVVGKTVEIDSAQKIFELGNAHYHAPAIGTEIPNGMTTVQFNYRRALTLHATEKALALAKIVFRLEADINGDHIEAGGSYCTVGLVVTESDE